MPRPNPSLLESKFQPQLGPRAQVRRMRLAVPEALVQGSVRAVSVVAPTGYGKTTLMAQWHGALSSLQPARVDVAWLNLDENDNDPPRLLRYLYAALGRCVPALAANAAQEISRTTNLSVILEDLSVRLAAHGRPVVLFLDDAQSSTMATPHEPSSGCCATPGRTCASSSAAGRPSAGRRRNCACAASCSRSTSATSPSMTTKRGASAPPDSRMHWSPTALARLLQKTEGWPAAMELLTLALNDAPDAGRLIADFATTERGVLEYLSDAVFGRLPAEQRGLAARAGAVRPLLRRARHWPPSGTGRRTSCSPNCSAVTCS